MTTVRFAHVLNSENHYESLSVVEHTEWSVFVHLFKIKQG